MKKTILCLSLICISSTSVVFGSLCGDPDWNPFEDEKCVKLFQTFATRNGAEDICNQQGATLVTIRSAAEQKFLSQYVLNVSEYTNVWIGAERRPNTNEFDWKDGLSFQRYTNWAIDQPIDDDRRSCVQMQSDLARQSDMKWAAIGCGVPAWFICQKLQAWPFEYLQLAILEARREHLRSVDSLTYQLEESPIPIGFIYVQLPNQPEPSRLWTRVEWSEITSEYAGLFFRAEGEGSATFGSIQAENSPRLTTVRGRLATSASVASVAVTANGGNSATLSAGATGAASHWGLSFTVSAGEVRPRNSAMRIWVRIN